MDSNKSSKPTKKELVRQKKIENKIETEKVKLGHPKGKERFNAVLKSVTKNNL